MNEERIFRINEAQRGLKEQFKGEEKVEDQLISLNGLQLADTRTSPLEPIFPVQPFTMGLAYLNQPEIKYPTQ